MYTTTSVSVQQHSTKLDQSSGRANLQITDDILKNLSNDVLPPQPFLISVPTDVPFHQPSRLANIWRAGTPFNFDEEELQYLSFHSHQEEDTLLQASGGWSDESGNILREEAQKQDFFGSGTSTPSAGPQKRKKITLGEYTKKGESKESTQTQEAPKLLDGKMAVATAKASHTQLKQADTDRMVQSKKRSIEQVEPTMPPRQNSVNASKTVTEPGKKARTSSPPRHVPQEINKPQEKPKKLPKLLSPNLPPTLVERKLPRLLSPTLPPGLGEMFAKKFPAEGPDTPKKTAPNPPSQGDSRIPSAEKPKEKHLLNLDVQRDRSGSQNSTKSTASIQRSDHDRKGKPSPSIVAAKDLQKIRQQQQEAQPSPGQKRIVVLKYGKRNSRTVLRLLKLAPKRKPTPDKDRARQEDETKDKPTESRPTGARKEKQPLPDAKEEAKVPAAKRPRIPPSLDSVNKPRTPVPQAFRSPLLQHNFSKSQLSTPKKPPKSIAMQRVESSEGDVRTPEGPVRSPRGANRTTTPLPFDQLRSATSSPSLTHHEDSKNFTSKPDFTPRSSSAAIQHPETSLPISTTPRSREEIHRAWRAQRDKYFPIGRSIKRSAQQLATPRESPPTSTSAKLSSVLFLEGLLAFMLNLAVNAKSQPVDWRSIMDYWAYVRNTTQYHPDLRGLCLHLGVVCMGHIHCQDMERVEKTPLPPPPPSGGNDSLAIASAPTPGSDGQATRLEGDVNTGASTDSYHRAKDRYNKMINEMTTNWRRLERTTAEAEEALPWSTFCERFPRTWERGMNTTKADLKRGQAEPEGVVDGIREEMGFNVPIRHQTNALEAVSWGMMALREWCGLKGVEWKSEIEGVAMGGKG